MYACICLAPGGVSFEAYVDFRRSRTFAKPIGGGKCLALFGHSWTALHAFVAESRFICVLLCRRLVPLSAQARLGHSPEHSSGIRAATVCRTLMCCAIVCQHWSGLFGTSVRPCWLWVVCVFPSRWSPNSGFCLALATHALCRLIGRCPFGGLRACVARVGRRFGSIRPRVQHDCNGALMGGVFRMLSCVPAFGAIVVCGGMRNGCSHTYFTNCGSLDGDVGSCGSAL